MANLFGDHFNQKVTDFPISDVEHARGRNRKQLVAVVVPVYVDFAVLPQNEKLALVQMKKILCQREIVFIHPPSVAVEGYERFLSPLNVRSVQLDAQYFGNAKRGNALLIVPDLYQAFAEYEYILIHHLDAFVFSDQLDYWCSQHYDYIGAPWFKKDYIRTPSKYADTDYLFLGVGNGGLSLRKISSFQRITGDRMFILTRSRLNLLYHYVDGRKYYFFRYVPGIRLFLKFIERFTMHEDKFWGLTVPRYQKWFKVASPEHATKFSFESLPAKLYEMNNHELPFGCHGWEKFGAEFWKEHILIPAG